MFPNTGVYEVSASSASNQWAVGDSSDFTHLLAEHRTAAGWRQMSPATGIKLGEGIVGTQVAATSGQQAWAFAWLSTGNSERVVGVHYNGTSWSAAHAFAGETALASAFATSSTDVWQLGGGGTGSSAPVAYHYNGTAWAKVAIPVSGAGSGTPAAGDWVLGQRGLSGASIEVVHWVKGAWRKVALPAGTVPAGQLAQAHDIVAVSATSVWASLEYGAVAGPNPGTAVLLHWNGSKWSKVSLPKGASAMWIASDGHGGLWAIEGAPGSEYLYHLSGGHWTKVALPVKPGHLTLARAPVLIPGAESVLAAGQLDDTKTGTQQFGVLRYGP
jgi:hypothetical protein